MGKSIVILAPDMRTQEVVQRRNFSPPLQDRGDLEPLGVLIEHRIDNVNEGFVAIEQPMSSRKQVALEPALALMLAQHFHHLAAARQKLIVRYGLRQPLPVGDLEHRLQSVRQGFVGPEYAKVSRRGV